MCLTHDVDGLKKFSLKNALLSVDRYVLGRVDKQSFKQAAWYLLTHKDPFDTFDKIVEMEKALSCWAPFQKSSL